jgi:hypothetical protein
MPPFRSVLFGLAIAILAAVVWIVVKFVLPIWLPYLFSRLSNDGGIGGAAATISSDSILIAAIIGFVVGTFWHFRRRSRSA